MPLRRPVMVQSIDFNPTVFTNGTTYTIYTIPRGWKLIGFDTEITTVFNGTTPTLKAGDGTITDRYALTTDITATALGLYPGKGTASTGIAATLGSLATAAAGLSVIITIGNAGGGPNAGAGRFHLTLMQVIP